MKNILLGSSVILSSFVLGSAVYACDMHGAGYGGFGLRNAQWQSYNPRVSKTDPSLNESVMQSPTDAALRNKSMPSFSNAASLAAAKAKAKLQETNEDESSERSEQTGKVEQTALNADR